MSTLFLKLSEPCRAALGPKSPTYSTSMRSFPGGKAAGVWSLPLTSI